MLEFGTDKPDLRNPLRIIDVTEFFQRCTFKPFKGRTVRAIKVNRQMSKGFHEKLLKFAQSIGMGGLGYLEVMEDMSYKGPIDKFIPDDMKVEMKELAGLSAGDTIFFIADKEARANLYAGQIRTELGEKLDLIEKNAYRFCYINDFPMFELDEETKQIGFTHNPFSMPQGGLEALKHRIRLRFWHISTILYVTVWSFLPALSATTIWRSWSKRLKLQAMMKKH